MFQAEIKESCYRNCFQRNSFGPCTIDRAAPNQLTIPLNKFPWQWSCLSCIHQDLHSCCRTYGWLSQLLSSVLWSCHWRNLWWGILLGTRKMCSNWNILSLIWISNHSKIKIEYFCERLAFFKLTSFSAWLSNPLNAKLTADICFLLCFMYLSYILFFQFAFVVIIHFLRILIIENFSSIFAHICLHKVCRIKYRICLPNYIWYLK